MDTSRCCETVTLHDPLRRSFGSWMGGREVASVHLCTLDEGHRAEHLAAADGSGQGWFRWDESGFRVGVAEVPDGGGRGGLAGLPRLAGSVEPSGGSEGSSTARPTPPPKGGHHASDAAVSSGLRSPVEALWALAAAIARLADVIVGASGGTASGDSTA
jgi:hypothetical protein